PWRIAIPCWSRMRLSSTSWGISFYARTAAEHGTVARRAAVPNDAAATRQSGHAGAAPGDEPGRHARRHGRADAWRAGAHARRCAADPDRARGAPGSRQPYADAADDPGERRHPGSDPAAVPAAMAAAAGAELAAHPDEPIRWPRRQRVEGSEPAGAANRHQRQRAERPGAGDAEDAHRRQEPGGRE